MTDQIPQYLERYRCEAGHAWPTRWRIDVPTEQRRSFCRVCDDGIRHDPIKGAQSLESDGLPCEFCATVTRELRMVDFRDGEETWACPTCADNADESTAQAERFRLMTYPDQTRRPKVGLNRR